MDKSLHWRGQIVAVADQLLLLTWHLVRFKMSGRFFEINEIRLFQCWVRRIKRRVCIESHLGVSLASLLLFFLWPQMLKLYQLFYLAQSMSGRPLGKCRHLCCAKDGELEMVTVAEVKEWCVHCIVKGKKRSSNQLDSGAGCGVVVNDNGEQVMYWQWHGERQR
jgi:hypothetical protein